MDQEPLPDTLIERAKLLESILLLACEYKKDQDHTYQELRREFIRDAVIKTLLPQFIRTSRDLAQFWLYIREVDGTYAGRRKHVRDALNPFFDHVEEKNTAPVDAVASDVLQNFDADGVHAIWRKALDRRHTDPEGAITAARTLLETVCKHIIEKTGNSYGDKDDLPTLYRTTAKQLNLAPSQHTEEIFKQILGGVTAAIEGLGALRNRIGDAHGQGARPVRPLSRHAQLSVNLAGTLATYLIETWLAKESTPIAETQ